MYGTRNARQYTRPDIYVWTAHPQLRGAWRVRGVSQHRTSGGGSWQGRDARARLCHFLPSITLTHAGSESAGSLGRGGFFPTSRLARDRICVHNCEPVRVTSATRLGGLFASHIKKIATRMRSEKRHHPGRPSNSDGTEIWHHPSRI